MSKDHITNNNIFEDLGFDGAESINLKVRSELMCISLDLI